MPSVTRNRKDSPQQSAKRREAIEQSLVNATNELVAGGQSFTEISVNELARTAGISRSTFYVYFRDKGDLVGRISQQMTNELIVATSCWIPYAEKAVWADIRQTVLNLMSVYERHGALMAALIETAAYDAEVAELSRQMMTRLVDQIRVGYDRITADNKHNPVGNGDVVKVLPFMLERCCYFYARGRPASELEWLAESMTQVLWSSLYNPELMPDKSAPPSMVG